MWSAGLELVLMCALWFAAGFAVCWAFGGLARFGRGEFTTETPRSWSRS